MSEMGQIDADFILPIAESIVSMAGGLAGSQDSSLHLVRSYFLYRFIHLKHTLLSFN